MRLLTWGANSHGQLSLKTINEQVNEPTEVSLHHSYNNNVRQVACGGGHTLLVDNDFKLYSCGWNTQQQLGHDDETNCFQRVWQLSGIKFTNIACGWDFSCGVTDDKFLFVWGSNSKGQLGLPREKFPHVVKPLRLQVNARKVSMGLRHTAILNSKGEVWVTGCGKHGQLGLGKDVTSLDRFQKVPNTGEISHIACGQKHTVAWSSSENALYVWGNNKYGQLLLSTDKYPQVFTAQKIDIDVKQKVAKLISGWTNVIMLLENGSVIGWGRNNYGQLGTEYSTMGNIVHINLPDGRIVKDIAVGSEHTICLADDNTLWAWGWNEHGNTGVETTECVFTPTMVPITPSENTLITQIYAGGAHNFLVIEESNYDSNKDIQE